MDFPHMMIYSCPTPFYMNKPLNHTDMENAIIEGAVKLEKRVLILLQSHVIPHIFILIK